MKKILEKYGVGEYGTDLNSVKTQLADIIRTGSAATIRDAIKTLQEEGEKPTQENLGITYIERPEDASEATAKTKLYEVFKSAGYAGDEDTFYKEFMPDADRSSMELLTKATSKGGLQMIDLNMSDPFSSLGSMEDLFAEADNIKEEQDKTESSYFKLGLDDEEDADTNEKADDFFGGLSSLFK